LMGKWAFRLADRKDACWGMPSAELDALYGSCDALLNVCGATDLREEHLAAQHRIYVETDPVTAELRLANGDEHTRVAFDNHHLIVTYGENYGAADCGVPLNGLDTKYRKIRQPIDIALWPMAFRADAEFFTTIGNYRQEGGDVAYQDSTYYWSKHREWEKLMELPRLTTQRFRLAMMPDREDDRSRLEGHGWMLQSPLEMSLDVFGAYPEFFRQSRAELTVAKDQNVRLRSGWFSERDACYLASGKPVVAQETGFSNVLPTGEGLFAFDSLERALDAIGRINADYERHARAARDIAEEHFEGGKVGRRFLQAIGLG